MTVVRSKRPRWLKAWEEIKDLDWKDILLGNGASIAIHRSFRYSSLLEVAKRGTCPNHLKPVDVELFEEFGTTDFERMLRTLYRSERVNEILKLDTAEHRRRYKAIRKALVGAISKIHPQFDELEECPLMAASDFLSTFERVFTTNYDLLLYWIVMYRKDRFGDYFWGKVFDQNDTELFEGRTAVIYLHGGLFLFSTENGAVKKIGAQRADLLTEVRKELNRGAVPVFVSEGTSKQKRAAIRRYDYLNFGFRDLRTSNNGLVIFGHSLSRQDNHVVETIRKSQREAIGYSVHRNGRSASQLELLRRDIANKFPGKRVLCFDSDSFPIYGAHRDMQRRISTGEGRRRRQ